ncbi:MAG TPA: SURF1 family protein [Anaerolineales bacterium]|nr:SURF1 family protein [Anaerolineales bacterium]
MKPTTKFIFLTISAIFITLFCYLGVWQLRRHAERQAQILHISARLSQPAVPFENQPNLQKYDLVEVVGQYLPEKALLWSSQSRNEVPGTHLLVPFRLSTPDGSIFLVDVGWVPIQVDGITRPAELVPSGEVQLQARLLTGRANGGWLALPPPPTNTPLDSYRWQVIDLTAISEYSGLKLRTDYYLERVPAEGKQAELPAFQSVITLDEGNHLLYAVQWFLFAFTSLVGAIVFARRR